MPGDITKLMKLLNESNVFMGKIDEHNFLEAIEYIINNQPYQPYQPNNPQHRPNYLTRNSIYNPQTPVKRSRTDSYPPYMSTNTNTNANTNMNMNPKPEYEKSTINSTTKHGAGNTLASSFNLDNINENGHSNIFDF